MVILLMVLKILGIIVLSVISLVLLLIGLVLFVPIRYELSVQKLSEDFKEAKGFFKFSWLLHLINGGISYPNQLYLRVRIFWFTIFRSDQSNQSIEQQTDKKNNQNKTNQKKSIQKQTVFDTEKGVDNAKISDVQMSSAEKTLINESISSDEGCSDSKINPSEENYRFEEDEFLNGEEESFSEKKDSDTGKKFGIKEFIIIIKNILNHILSTLKKIPDWIRNKAETLELLKKKIAYYNKILESQTFEMAFQKAKNSVYKLIKHVMPRRIKGSVLMGFEDPALTADIYSYYCMLYFFHKKKIVLTPDFNNRFVLTGSINIKGHITVVTLLIIAIKVYFDKNIRKVIKAFKGGQK